ncbi:hypothetical protein AHIS2_p012 [Acaryochloris phage A-HIS2]|nr:hypothetical protein AHIS2_p012 [Acaryochloris phage A-HIS2]
MLHELFNFAGITLSGLVSLSIHKIFLEDMVTNWGRVLTHEALAVILREIDEALIQVTLSTEEPLTAPESRAKIQELAEKLTGASWDTSQQRKAVNEVIQAFDFTIYTEKLTRRIKQDFTDANVIEVKLIEGPKDDHS